VQVDVEIQRAAEALHDRDGAAPTIGDPVAPSATAQEPEHRTQGHAGYRPTQLVIPREQVPQPMRQDPLSDRHVGEDMIDEMRRPLGHPPTTAPRTESPSLAREGAEAIQSAGDAPKARESADEASAPQEVAELLLDEARKPGAVPQRRGLRAEGLEMVPHDPVQNGG